MVGSEVWQDALTLLIYQRKANTGAGAKMNLPDFATHEFVLQKDVCCSLQGIKNKDKEDESGYETSNVLTKKFFYKTLLLGAYFGWDTLENFARRQPLSRQEREDLHILSRTICTHPDYKSHIVMPVWYKFYPTGFGDSIFSVFSRQAACSMYTSSQNNLALIYKFGLHCDFTVFGDEREVMETNEFELVIDEFLGIYVLNPEKSMGNLIEKFDFSCGWDAQHPSQVGF